MAEYVQLGRLATLKSSDAVISPQPGAADAATDTDMAESDSREPLLGSPDSPRDSREGLRGSDEYGTSGNKHAAQATVLDADSDEDDDLLGPGGNGTGGVQQADAINLVWSRNALILAYFL